MALFTVTINAYTNLSPSIIGDNSITISHNTTHIFTKFNFTTETIPQYSDPEGDDLNSIKILTIPSTGSLVLDPGAVPVVVNDTIPVASLNSGLLKYIADIGTITSYNENFTFDVTDVGSLSLAGLIGTITMDVLAKDNQAPSVVGDGTMTLAYGQTGIFTVAMFTTAATPAYSDPEGDAANELKILTLPILGKIQYNGIDSVVNDVITFADIALGLLTYVPDLADTDGDIQGFTYSIADVGSGIFVS